MRLQQSPEHLFILGSNKPPKFRFATASFQYTWISDYERTACISHFRITECFQNDLRADPGRIAHGNRYDRF